MNPSSLHQSSTHHHDQAQHPHSFLTRASTSAPHRAPWSLHQATGHRPFNLSPQPSPEPRPLKTCLGPHPKPATAH
ncbi:hypothetical protein V6N13_053850 [Hibiscus sabdariffa]